MNSEQHDVQSADGHKGMSHSGAGNGSGGGQGTGGGGGKGTGGGGGQGGGIGGGGLGDLPGEANGSLLTIDGLAINTSAWRSIEIELTPKNDQFDAIHHGSDKRDTLKGKAGQENFLKGYEHHDRLHGHKRNDHLRGGAGHDTLKGGNGNDLLIGAIGNDHLSGNKGKDILFGGDQNDTMKGGKGKDVFILSKGKDVIKDFDLRKDCLGIERNVGLNIKTKQKGKNLLLKGSDNIRTILIGINRDDFLAAFDADNSSSAPGRLIIVSGTSDGSI